MTDPINPGTTPESTPPAAAWPPPADPALPPIESTEPGAAAPAQAVQRDSGYAVTGRTRRSTGLRWAVALVGVAIVLVATAAVFALTAGGPKISAAVGYMPDNVVQYGEYRLDLPGDQRQKVAEFLSAFPGFKDQSTIDAKLDETFDKIVAAVSSNEQTYTADIKPWFGGIVAVGSSVPATGDTGSLDVSSFTGSQPLIVVTVTDQAKAADWVASLHEASLTRGDYNGAILFSGQARDAGPAFAIAVTDKVHARRHRRRREEGGRLERQRQARRRRPVQGRVQARDRRLRDVHVHGLPGVAGVVPRHDQEPRRLGRARQDRGRRRARLARPGLVRVGRPVRERRPRRQLRLPVGRHRLRRPQQEEHAAGLGAAGHDRLRRGPRRRRGDHRAARSLPQAARGQAGASTRSTRPPGSASTGSSAGGATRRSSSSADSAGKLGGGLVISPTDAAAAKTAADIAPRAARDRRRPGRDQAPRRPARRRDDHRRRLQRRRRDAGRVPGRLQAGAGVHVHRPGRRHRLRPVVRRERPRRRPRPVARGRRARVGAREARRRGEPRLHVPRPASRARAVRGLSRSRR